MAQVSRPQPGNVVTTPAYVDAGPYTGDQWADRLRVAYTVDETTMGPLLGIDSELAVTYGGLNVTVAKGAGLCDGHLLFNTTAATIAVNGPAGGTRTDYVCMVENNGAAQIPVGALTNYDTAGNVAIPPYSCRLAVVKDCPANFSQTNALYMVRLATITTQAAAITSLTDNRTFCQFATDLQDDVVTTSKIANLAVTTAKIDDLAVTTGKIADDAVDDTKAGDRVPQFYRRQGYNAAHWGTPGVTLADYTPTAVRMQAGVYTYTWGGGVNTALITVTFPVAFSYCPLALATAYTITKSESVTVSVVTISTTTLKLYLRYWGATYTSVPPLSHQTAVYWLAAGPE